MSRLPRSLLRLLRPILPGWPDAGRKIVQTPTLREFLSQSARAGSLRAVLNAGCGEGLFAPLILATCRPELQIEMDLSPAGARHLRSSRQRYVCGSLTHIPLRSASIDLVVCSEVLEHVRNDEEAAAEIARVLRIRGWLVLSVPTPPAVPDPNHVREGYTPKALTRLLSAQGLQCVASRTCMHLFFRSVLRWWRPGFVPWMAITGLSWLDRILPLGPPMDVVVLARKQ